MALGPTVNAKEKEILKGDHVLMADNEGGKVYYKWGKLFWVDGKEVPFNMEEIAKIGRRIPVAAMEIVQRNIASQAKQIPVEIVNTGQMVDPDISLEDILHRATIMEENSIVRTSQHGGIITKERINLV
jgi:hypothetical protein